MLTHDSQSETGLSYEGNEPDSRVMVRASERKANAALQMRIAGAQWDEIAEVIGYASPHAALIAVEKALESNLGSDESQQAMRRLGGKRLERLLRSVWPKAIDPENPEHLQAVTKARELVDRHAKMFGYDAPQEVVVHTPTANELETWVAGVVGVKQPPVLEHDIFGDDVVDGEVLSDTGETP